MALGSKLSWFSQIAEFQPRDIKYDCYFLCFSNLQISRDNYYIVSITLYGAPYSMRISSLFDPLNVAHSSYKKCRSRPKNVSIEKSTKFRSLASLPISNLTMM